MYLYLNLDLNLSFQIIELLDLDFSIFQFLNYLT